MKPEIGKYYWVKLDSNWEIAKAELIGFRKKQLSFAFTDNSYMTFRDNLEWDKEPIIKNN